MSPAIMAFVTDFADQAVILPLVAGVALVVAAQRRWRVLFAWLCSVSAVLGTVLLLKLLCYSCAWLAPVLGPDAADLRSPSGHAAAAAVTYAGIAALQAAGSRWIAVWTGLTVSVLAAALIGVTRLGLGAHSVGEVGAAAVVGVAGAVVFPVLAGRRMLTGSGIPVLLAAMAIVALTHGRHLPAEAVIQQQGVVFVRRLVPACEPGPDGVAAQGTTVEATR